MSERDEREKNCKHCERRFTPEKVWQKFCCFECKKKFHAQLRTELVRKARRMEAEEKHDDN